MKGLKEGFQGERKVVLPPMIVDMMHRDRLASSLYVTDIGYYPNASNHYCERRTPISQYVLIYCVEGMGWYKYGSEEFNVQRGEYFILPPDIPHSYGSMEGNAWTIYWVHFSGEHASVYAEGMQVPHKINVATNSRIMERINIFEELLKTLQSGESLEDLRYASSLLHHFLASMRYLGNFRKTRQGNRTETEPQASTKEMMVTESAIYFMKENIENHLTLKNILDYTGYSQSHFSTIFKKHTGMSPLEYFNDLKIKKACRLLEDTDLKINQICHKLGIKDPYYFSRLFTKTVNIPPTDYRKKTQSD